VSRTSQRLKRCHGAGMQGDPLVLAEAGVDAVADQGVREPLSGRSGRRVTSPLPSAADSARVTS
jgi:hypothetical protein